MNIKTNDSFPALHHEIRAQRNWGMDYLFVSQTMQELQPRLAPIIDEVAAVIASTRPLVVPMTWSMYPERLWNLGDGCVAPCVTVPLNYVSWNRLEYDGYTTDKRCEVYKDTATIHVRSEPCWNAYKRWGWEMIDSFYAALRALRLRYGIKWEDISETSTERSWGPLRYSYRSIYPITTLTTKIDEVKRYGEVVNERQTLIHIMASFELPNTPEAERDAANCHVVEEEITERVTRKVRRIKCA